MLFARAVDGRFSDLIKQGVSLTIEYPVALLDGGQTDGLSQVAFAGAGRTQEQSVFVFSDKASRSQIKDQRAIELFVEGKVEVVQGFLRVAELGLFLAPLQQALLLRESSSEIRQEIRSMGAIDWAWAWSKRVSKTAAMPPRRSCFRARLSSIRFIFFLLGSEVDEIAVFGQFTDQRIDMTQSESWGWRSR